jgi:hypothetical protein
MLEMYGAKRPISAEDFDEMASKSTFVKKVLENNLVIAHWRFFKDCFVNAYNEIKEDP